MAPQSQFAYAQLPVYKYQFFDPENLKFCEHPITPPSQVQMSHFSEDVDADEQPKNDDAPVDPPADIETPDSIVEIIDDPADAPGDGTCTLDSRRCLHHIEC